LLGYLNHGFARLRVVVIFGEKHIWQLSALYAIIVSYGFLQLNIFAFNLA
jgi:hypothetical protein